VTSVAPSVDAKSRTTQVKLAPTTIRASESRITPVLAPLLATKLHIPPARPNLILRPRLTERKLRFDIPTYNRI
jgi:hypothetical protein